MSLLSRSFVYWLPGGVQASRDRQRYYSPRVHIVSTKTDERGFEWTKSLDVHFQLLEGRGK